jgi:hypothetical protein
LSSTEKKYKNFKKGLNYLCPWYIMNKVVGISHKCGGFSPYGRSDKK